MNFKRITVCVCALACAATLGASGIASALATHRTLANTYPEITRLCEAVRAGKGPSQVRTFTTQVLADCATLEAKFHELTTTAIAGQTAVLNAIALNRATFHATCPKIGKTRPAAIRPACRAADSEYLRLLSQLHQVGSTYVKALHVARDAFWTAVDSLPGVHLGPGAAVRHHHS
jgi:hypothetical protein